RVSDPTTNSRTRPGGQPDGLSPGQLPKEPPSSSGIEGSPGSSLSVHFISDHRIGVRQPGTVRKLMTSNRISAQQVSSTTARYTESLRQLRRRQNVHA